MSATRPGLATSALALALVLPAEAPQAHPHAWIDLDTRLIFDDAGKLEAVELHWLFDEFYTAFIAEEFTTAGLAPAAFLEEVAAENLANLEEFDYFTDLRQNDVRLDLGEVRRFATSLEGERLWLEFEVVLAEPADPTEGRIDLAVYDPTYYVEVLYHEGHSPALDGIDAENCTVFVMPPTPTPDQIAQAFALDLTQTGENGLGRYFAEIAQIECR
jgi:ABC-type uncharacterized transport system substrate-binding protein